MVQLMSQEESFTVTMPPVTTLPVNGIALADLGDIGDDALVERFDGGAHPVGLLGIVAELVGVAEGGVLCGDLAPHIPAAALLDLGVVGRGGVLAAHRGVLHAAAVGDEHEIVLGEVDGLASCRRGGRRCAWRPCGRALQSNSTFVDLHAEVELHAEALEVLDHRQDHGLILVVLREAQRREVGQSADVVDIALDIELHLQRAVPVLKGEHRAPVEPEVGIEHLVVEEVGDTSCPAGPRWG